MFFVNSGINGPGYFKIGNIKNTDRFSRRNRFKKKEFGPYCFAGATLGALAIKSANSSSDNLFSDIDILPHIQI